MPTNRPRYMITETAAVAEALEAAARQWPADRTARGRLLLHLIDKGYHALQAEQERRQAEWQVVLESTGGTVDYGPGYLDELRKDWPE
jgi:hypothetical protein